MKRRLFALVIAVFATAMPMRADFNDIASVLEHRFGFSRTWIPLFGFVRLGVQMVRPNGVHDIQLAVYEHQTIADPRQIEPFLVSTVGHGYAPLVRVRSNRNGEWTFVFARPAARNRVDLLVFSHDRDETVLVRVDVDMKVMAGCIRDHNQIAFLARD